MLGFTLLNGNNIDFGTILINLRQNNIAPVGKSYIKAILDVSTLCDPSVPDQGGNNVGEVIVFILHYDIQGDLNITSGTLVKMTAGHNYASLIPANVLTITDLNDLARLIYMIENDSVIIDHLNNDFNLDCTDGFDLNLNYNLEVTVSSPDSKTNTQILGNHINNEIVLDVSGLTRSLHVVKVLVKYFGFTAQLNLNMNIYPCILPSCNQIYLVKNVFDGSPINGILQLDLFGCGKNINDDNIYPTAQVNVNWSNLIDNTFYTSNTTFQDPLQNYTPIPNSTYGTFNTNFISPSYQTEIANECAKKCYDNSDCTFFTHDPISGSNNCNLFSGDLSSTTSAPNTTIWTKKTK